MKKFGSKLTTQPKGVEVKETPGVEHHCFDTMEDYQKHVRSEDHQQRPDKVHVHVLHGDLTIHEHDKIPSRTTGLMHEIKFGPVGGNMVPANPFTSVAGVMHEFKHGKLHSGSKKGPVVKSPEQAIAIALSEKRKAGK